MGPEHSLESGILPLSSEHIRPGHNQPTDSFSYLLFIQLPPAAKNQEPIHTTLLPMANNSHFTERLHRTIQLK